MLKKVVSLLLFFSLFFMMLTSLVVFVEPSPRVASWANWTFLGLSRQHWEGAHLGMGLLFMAAGLLHLALNWDALLDHLRDDDGAVVVFTKPFFLGLGLSVVLFVAFLAGVPPIHQLVSLSGYLKDRAADTFGEPPYAMAERSTLEDFARRMGIDAEKALALLRLRNIKADSATETLAAIAARNNVAPGGVFEALKMVMEPSGGGRPELPKDPPPGLGRRRISDICEEYGLDLKAVMQRLSAAGFKAQPAWTLSEVSKASNALPIAVYEALRAEKNLTPIPVEVPPAAVTPAPRVQASTVHSTPPAPGAQIPAAPQTLPPVAAQTAQPQGLQQAAVLPNALPNAPQSVPQAVPQSATPPASPYAPRPFVPGQTPQTYGAPGQPTPPQAARPATPPPGLAKMMLQSFCREYDIPLSTAVQRLGRQHITAFGDMTFEELGLENNRTPADIMRLVVTP